MFWLFEIIKSLLKFQINSVLHELQKLVDVLLRLHFDNLHARCNMHYLK